MNLELFSKGQGENCNDILGIVAKMFSDDLVKTLWFFGKHNPELDAINDGAYLELGPDGRYVNITYNFAAPTLKLLIEGFGLFKKELLKTNAALVSFREKPEVERLENGQLSFYTRIAFIPPKKK